MLVDRRQHNRNVRLHRAKKLLRNIGVGKPLRISLTKTISLSENIHIDALAWAIAICESNYLNFGSINQDVTLYDKLFESAEHYLSLLKDIVLQAPTDKRLLMQYLYEENDADESVMMFKIPPEFVDEILSEDKRFATVLNQTNPTQYAGDAIGIAIVQHILPEAWHNQNIPPSDKERNILAWSCFCKLPDALIKLGATITTSHFTARNKKAAIIIGLGKFNEPIKMNFDAFRKTFQKKLLPAYLNDSPCAQVEH